MNQIQNEIERLIKENDKLIKANEKAIKANNELIKKQKDLVSKLNTKLAIGNVINNRYVVCSNYFVEYVCNELRVRVLVHPNLSLIGDDVDDVAFGCAYDMLIIPISHIDKIKVSSLGDLIINNSEQFLNAQKTRFIPSRANKIKYTRSVIDRLKKELAYYEKDLERDLEIQSNPDAYLQEYTSTFVERAKESALKHITDMPVATNFNDKSEHFCTNERYTHYL